VNLAACWTLPTNPVNGTVYRAALPWHLATIFQTAYTAVTRSRFNPGPLLPAPERYEILYLAGDPIVAPFEVWAMLGQPWSPANTAPNPAMPSYIILPIKVILHSVVDLTDVSTAHIPLQISAQELTGDWDCYGFRSSKTVVSGPVGISPTQDLGREIFRTGVEGFWTISANAPYQRNLVVFPQNLQAKSSVIVIDPHSRSGATIAKLP
jgi:hypothetical protein